MYLQQVELHLDVNRIATDKRVAVLLTDIGAEPGSPRASYNKDSRTASKGSQGPLSAKAHIVIAKQFKFI